MFTPWQLLKATLVGELVNVSGTRAEEYVRAALVDECLSFDAYVRLLEMAHRQGLKDVLNSHYRPQDIACKEHDQGSSTVTTYRGTTPPTPPSLAFLLKLLNIFLVVERLYILYDSKDQSNANNQQYHIDHPFIFSLLYSQAI